MSKCAVCTTKKPTLECGLCHSAICKSCTDFVDQSTFRYAPQIPNKLQASPTYCLNCYTTDVMPEIEKYENLLAEAKEIRVYDITQTKETRLLKRLEPVIEVNGCVDTQEATMKLAFITAKLGFNCMIDMRLKTTKTRDSNNYQSSEVTGSAIPTHLDESKVMRDRTFSDPN